MKKNDKTIFYSKEEYLNAIDIEDKKIDDAEDRIEELRKMLVDLDDTNSNSSSKSKKSSKSKSSKKTSKAKSSKVKTTNKKEDKKARQNEIPVDKKHEVVSLGEFDDYDYDRRRKDWHKKAGHNDPQVVCDFCKDDDNWATIKLENGKDICYYCWIKKPETLGAKKSKSKSTSKSFKVKTVESKKAPKEPKKAKNTPPKKHEAVEVELLDLYDYKKKLAIWRKSAGDNLTDQGCDQCGGKQYERTILLKNGKHVCWYCWIKKPEGSVSVSEYNRKKQSKKK